MNPEIQQFYQAAFQQAEHYGSVVQRKLMGLGIEPPPYIQRTPAGWIVILGPFKTRKEALWRFWENMETKGGIE